MTENWRSPHQVKRSFLTYLKNVLKDFVDLILLYL